MQCTHLLNQYLYLLPLLQQSFIHIKSKLEDKLFGKFDFGRTQIKIQYNIIVFSQSDLIFELNKCIVHIDSISKEVR